MTFTQLIQPLQKALKEQNYSIPTPIQEQTIPALLEGKDVLGVAQTGTGKTAAFLLPILQHLDGEKSQPKYPRALILTPTRELAAQIADSIKTYGRHLRLRGTAIFGGVKQGNQVAALKRGIDILVATPGRLLDLMQQKHVFLDAVDHFVLDEADRMLDMGFIPDIRKIIKKLPHKRQTLFFSATMLPQAKELADSILQDPITISITPEKPTVEKIDQHVIMVNKKNKLAVLKDLLEKEDKAIVFTRTKHMANRVADKLSKSGISSVPLHGNKSQSARTKALDGFRCGKVRVLVATDIAARGIDVDDISHVYNYELPQEAESYVHRIGRTARAGASGIAIALVDGPECGLLKSIEKLIAQKIPVMEHKLAGDLTQGPPQKFGGHKGGRGKGRRRRRR
ncbi:MAG: DEAD/DEAH box helicase [Nanoarchaeota archaeon]